MTRETLGSAPASAHPSGGAPRWRSAVLFLGVATALGHALSYAFSLVLSRALGPADFGALGALLGVAVVATVPATALQTQVARFAAVGYHAAGARQSHRLSWWVGLGQGLLLAVLALPLTAALRLDTGLGVLLLGAGLLPTSVIAARQGALLGRGEFGLLATTMVLVPALRLVGAGVAAASDMGVAGAIGMQTVATWVALAAVAVIVRPASDAAVTAADDTSVVPRMAGVLTSSAGLLGLFVLANVDVLLARMFLSDAQSGVYAVGALGAKLMFWGSQFVALLVFPRVARRESGRAVLALPGMVVAGIGVAATVASTWLAAPVLDLLVGPAYAEAAGHFPWFVALGTLLALVQLQTYAAVAVDAHRASVLLWFSVAVLAAVVALAAHDDVRDIVGAAIAAAGLLVVANTVLVWRTRS